MEERNLSMLEVQQQVTIYLSAAKIGYRADFMCFDCRLGQNFYVEAKGFQDPVWMLKKKLWKHYGPARLEIYKGTYKRVYLDETIYPEPGLEEGIS